MTTTTLSPEETTSSTVPVTAEPSRHSDSKIDDEKRKTNKQNSPIHAFVINVIFVVLSSFTLVSHSCIFPYINWNEFSGKYELDGIQSLSEEEEA